MLELLQLKLESTLVPLDGSFKSNSIIRSFGLYLNLMIEYELLEKIEKKLGSVATFKTLESVEFKNKTYPIVSLEMGKAEKAPVFGLFSGVHGIERIGTHLVLNYLNSFAEQLQWDETLHEMLKKIRIVSIPIINPVGLDLKKRSNGNDVDLMRDAPQSADIKTYIPVSGQSLSPKLPWYRGLKDDMEPETKAVIKFVNSHLSTSDFMMSLDVHSGFGMVDRLWYPYGYSKKKIKDFGLIQKFEELLNNNISYHVYKLEQQSDSYVIHGDLWDYLYDQNLQTSSNIYIPWTLELGSWVWVKKNPRQALSFSGFFNPILPHRYKRTMRRHRSLLDFMIRSTLNHSKWAP